MIAIVFHDSYPVKDTVKKYLQHLQEHKERTLPAMNPTDNTKVLEIIKAMLTDLKIDREPLHDDFFMSPFARIAPQNTNSYPQPKK
jgi:hypothetical protein